MLLNPKQLIMPILSLLLIIPEGWAWERSSFNYLLTYGGVYKKCLNVGTISNNGCQCMSECFALSMNKDTNIETDDVYKIVKECAVNKCKRYLE